jgi:hypothetical protein
VLARHLQKDENMNVPFAFLALLIPVASAFACGDTTDDDSTAAWAVCSLDSQCTLAAKSSCGVWGAPSIEDVDAAEARAA